MQIGEKIRELRIEHNLLQRELAELIHIAPNTLSQFEKCQANPSYEVLVSIANYFQVSIDYLLGREDDFGTIHIHPTTDPINSLSGDEQKIIDFIRKNPPLHATEWISLYTELPPYMQESIFAELRGMHLGYKAAKADKPARK